MRIRFVVVVLVVAFGSAVMGQNQPIKIRVIGEPNANASSSEMADRLKGHVGSSSRYALVTVAGSESIDLYVQCLFNTTERGQNLGIICHAEITYWPVSDVALTTDLTGSMATGEEAYVAQSLYDSFVQATSDEKLNLAASDFKRYLNTAIKRHPNGI